MCVDAYSGYQAAYERYQRLQRNTGLNTKVAILPKRPSPRARNWHCSWSMLRTEICKLVENLNLRMRTYTSRDDDEMAEDSEGAAT